MQIVALSVRANISRASRQERILRRTHVRMRACVRVVNKQYRYLVIFLKEIPRILRCATEQEALTEFQFGLEHADGSTSRITDQAPAAICRPLSELLLLQNGY